MGGSSLGARGLHATFWQRRRALELIVLDTTHPETIQRVAGELDLRRRCSSSPASPGGTTETLSHFAHFWDATPDRQPVRRDHRPGDLRSRRSRASTGSGRCS
jgi:transaldolase/glucose-6-phosphate isomerase